MTTLIIVSDHISKAFDKWNGWLGGIALPFKDPLGEKTFQAIFVEKTMAEPGKVLPVSVVHWIPFAILMIGGSVALYKITRTNLHTLVTSREISSMSKALPLVLAALFWALWLVNVWCW